MAAPTSSDATSIFHEKQIAALCGRHAINNLLQGAYIDEFSLAAIAAELDAKERELMLAEGTDTPDAIRFLAEDSHNVDDAGNFSVSVLSEYLHRAHGVTLESDPAAMSAALADPNSYSAYFLNFEHHWFALRRLRTKSGPRWFNLNSTLKVPEVISDFFLSAYLAQLRSQGYTIFPVGGRALPEPFANGLGGPGTLHTVGQILAAGAASASSASSAAEARRQAAQRAREEAAADPDMAAALQASLAQSDFASYAEYEAATGGGNAKRPRTAGPGEDEEAQLRQAIAESLGAGGSGGAGPTSKGAFAIPSFSLAMAGLPPRTLVLPEEAAEPQTIAALLGPATSASLTLRPTA